MIHLRRFFICFVLTLAAYCAQAQSDFAIPMESLEACYDVIPRPQTVTLTEKTPFGLGENTCILYPEVNTEVARVAKFLQQFISESTCMTLPIRQQNGKKDALGNIVLALDKRISGQEAYNIIVTTKGITITASTAEGLFRAAQTLRKSLPVQPKSLMVAMPTVNISDSPRFGYRGMHLDCSRHFFSVDFVKQYIDMLALHGMNRFHWHLSDDQGWRPEIKCYPRLTEIGAYRSGTTVGRNTIVDDGQRYGGSYTQQEMRDIVAYAKERYIEVVPEIDMPGHMLGALAAYPQLGCTGGPYEVSHLWGVFPDVLCMGNDEVMVFVKNILDEIADIFPYELIHIGGDECPRDRWKVCEKCQNRINELGLIPREGQSKEDLLQGWFAREIQKYMSQKGRRVIGWDEILGCDVDTTTIIMSWRGAEPGAKAASLGHDVIMTPVNPMYFDYYQSKDERHEPLSIGGYVPVEAVYAFEPVAEALPTDKAQHILGVQANVWAEYIACTSHVEYMVLPRMAALSEVQWTQPERKDYDSFLKRSWAMKAIYDRYNWTVAPHIFK